MNLFATTALMAKYWPGWALWIVLFLFYELNALRLRGKYPDVNHDGGTLSELVWWLIRGEAWWHHVLYGALLAFFIDLGLHFFAGTSLF